MEDFKNEIKEGTIRQTPSEWLEELSEDLRLKLNIDISKICIVTALKDGYEKGLNVIEYIDENLLDY